VRADDGEASVSGPRWFGLPRRELAAAWWSASLRARAPLGLLARWSGPLAWAGAGLTLPGCAELLDEGQKAPSEAALEAQRMEGWSVGQEGHGLAFPDAQPADVAGSTAWRMAMTTLALRLAPAEARWLPFYDPTLFQALQAPRSADLQLMMRPVFSPAMALASRRAEALLSLFMEGGGCRTDVALVLDLPGPEAMAVAAALSPCFDPVFLLDNWPHPRGLVPSHLTLGAALYYLPWFERARPGRSPEAAPMFVLDRGRLVPYVDDGSRFDNRYFANLPPASALAAAGIRRLLYVTPDDQVAVEADDLNEDMVDLARGGVDIKILALSDFSDAPLPDWPDEPLAQAPAAPPPPPPSVGVSFQFGGTSFSHRCFWQWYGWPRPSTPAPPPTKVWVGKPVPLVTPTPPPVTAVPTTGWAGKPPPPVPAALTARAQFHPTARPSAWAGSPGGGFTGRSGSLGRVHPGGGSSG
jgi:hypothetical protein